MKIKNEKLRIKQFFVVIFSLATCYLLLTTLVSAAEWAGVDETVVEKYAEEHGRKASNPLINTDQGDLLLFVFLLAGAIGGFAAGYCWRMLIEQKPKNNNVPIHRTF